MKVLGTATALAAGTTKFTTSTAVWVNNTNTSAGDVTVRNADDDADVGTISIPPNPFLKKFWDKLCEAGRLLEK